MHVHAKFHRCGKFHGALNRVLCALPFLLLPKLIIRSKLYCGNHYLAEYSALQNSLFGTSLEFTKQRILQHTDKLVTINFIFYVMTLRLLQLLELIKYIQIKRDGRMFHCWDHSSWMGEERRSFKEAFRKDWKKLSF